MLYTKWKRKIPKFGDPSISLEIIFDRLGLDDPLIGPISLLMNKLSGLIGVHRLNLTLCVLDIWALYFKALDKHVYQLLSLSPSNISSLGRERKKEFYVCVMFEFPHKVLVYIAKTYVVGVKSDCSRFS